MYSEEPDIVNRFWAIANY